MLNENSNSRTTCFDQQAASFIASSEREVCMAMDITHLMQAFGGKLVDASAIKFYVQRERGYIGTWENGGMVDYSAQVLECDEFKMKLLSKEAANPHTFALMDAACDAIPAAHEKLNVYLFFPFKGTEGRQVTIHAGNQLYWIKGGRLLASGSVCEMYLSELIVLSNGLIIPATATRDQHDFAPIKLSAKAPANCQSEVKNLAAYASQMKRYKENWAARVEHKNGIRALPFISVQIAEEFMEDMIPNLDLAAAARKKLRK
ncbi:hypothetical protein [Duganella vulcania]|uniref:Uncharacterized protein n=1 Tax=Duganella vulcania TaxID=2692166 RepID=A0A845GS56_9BURK|nr:hypothetical protein [Duganella vulcania]MYM96495.1 hypothetical protein [Duganella vulcania]